MAIILQADYAKKLGLPGYSSHQFSVSVKTEVSDLSDIEGKCQELYNELQHAVDVNIQQTGFVPEDPQQKTNGHSNGFSGNGHRNGHHPQQAMNGHHQNSHHGDWHCSPKQKALILRVVDEGQYSKQQVEELARERFGKGVTTLNKMEASGLIDELLESSNGGSRSNGSRNGGRNGFRNGQSRYAGARGGAR